ncbi:MAG: lysophospholipid acyltransferase family protein [Planctomycetaceae bacterium]
MSRLKVRQTLEYLLFRFIVCVVRALPLRASVWLAKGLGGMVFHVLPRKLTRHAIAGENIRTAFGDDLPDTEVDRIIHQMWVHLFRVIIEIAQLPNKIRLYNCADVIRFYNRELSVQALSQSRPVIFLSGHFGNWELANTTFGCFGYPTGVVARDLDNPWLHRWFERFRQHTGHRLISKKGGSDLMIEFLDAGGTLGLLGDQDAGRRGLFVDFFGKPASTFKSIALLARQYDAIIAVAYARRLPDDFKNARWTQFELGCEAVLDPRDYGMDIEQMTQDYTTALENAVRKAPEQYFWVHRRWKSIPGQKRNKRSA